VKKSDFLYIGNFLSRTAGTKPFCETLTDRLEQEVGISIQRTSSKPGKVSRLLDIIQTTFRFGGHGRVIAIDVFSSQAFLWAEVAAAIASARGCRTILILRGGTLPERGKRNPKRMARLFRQATEVVTASGYLRKELAGFGKEVGFLPNGIDLSVYPYCFRNQISPKMVWVRALKALYRPWDGVHAFSKIFAEFPEATIEFVGPDSGDGSAEKVMEAAKKLGVFSAVTLAGSVPHEKIPEVLDKADIFLNTTTAESFGVSVMEAAACGLCIVTTDAGELPYIWENEKDAIVVPVGDVEGMAEGIRRFLNDPALSSRVSMKAREKAERYDWEHVLPEWKKLLQRNGVGC